MKKNIEPVQLPFGEQFEAMWKEWMTYRGERRLPAYKPTGLKRTFAGIVRDSGGSEEVACKMLEQSIEKNWQGIFKLKNYETNLRPATTGAAAGLGASQLLDRLRAAYVRG
jgi:hypothetical protein